MEDWGHASKIAQIQLVHTTAGVHLVIHCLPMAQVVTVRIKSTINSESEINPCEKRKRSKR